jgi:hypothetical protein
VEPQSSAQLRAASTDVIADLASAVDADDAFAMQIRHTTIECALGAANAAGA